MPDRDDPMNPQHAGPPGEAHSAEGERAQIEYADRDINLRMLAIFGGSVVVAVVLVLAVVAVGLNLGAPDSPRGREGLQLPESGFPVAKPPRLQVNEPNDLAALRASEAARLNGYWWVDQSKGVVAIPIDRAIEITAQRGLPSRPKPGPTEVPAYDWTSGQPPTVDKP